MIDVMASKLQQALVHFVMTAIIVKSMVCSISFNGNTDDGNNGSRINKVL